MARKDIKSCHKVEADMCLVSDGYCLGSTQKYYVLYICGSTVTLGDVCYELVCRETLHILETEWTRAKGWTVFAAQSTTARLMAPPCLSTAVEQ